MALSNEQIAEFLAVTVMGWHKARHDELKAPPSCWFDDTECVHRIAAWHPATDLNQAVQAAEKVARERNEPVNLIYWPDDNTWSAGWEGEDDTLGYVSIIGPADALARAVVKATGGTDEY